MAAPAKKKGKKGPKKSKSASETDESEDKETEQPQVEEQTERASEVKKPKKGKRKKKTTAAEADGPTAQADDENVSEEMAALAVDDEADEKSEKKKKGKKKKKKSAESKTEIDADAESEQADEADGDEGEGERTEKPKRGQLSKFAREIAEKAKSEAGISSGEKSVTISKAERARRKWITTIKGLETYGLKPKAVQQAIARRFACSASVGGSAKEPEVNCQGDIEHDVADWLASTFQIEKKTIYTITKTGKRTRMFE